MAAGIVGQARRSWLGALRSGSALRSRASRAALTQLPNVPRLIPRLNATSLIDLLEPNTSSTASRWNSGGYFAGRPIRASLLWNNVQNQVSEDRGQLHSGNPQSVADSTVVDGRRRRIG